MLSHTQRDALFKFSLNIYKHLQTRNRQRENFICSPFSIACALATFASGACKATAKQIFAALNLKASKCRIEDQFSNLLTVLSVYAPEVTFHVANRIYSDEKFAIHISYRALLDASYGTTIKSVAFVCGHESIRRNANAWVSKQTGSNIPAILPSGSVDTNTALIHLSAICFRGSWEWPFDSVQTTRQMFRLNDSKVVPANMMYQYNSFNMGYSDELCASALEMPYRGQMMSMVILLPDDVQGLRDLEQSLTPANLSGLLASMEMVDNVHLFLPKFRIEHSVALRETLEDLGVKDLFTPGQADLSGAFETGAPSVSDVVHKALVQVHEDGTEPEAAATNAVFQPAVRTAETAACFFVNHPFMLLIKMNDLDVILFLGSVRKL
ncbi:hypothetical protein V5799_014839 [Amblyomma americanum]|uniref:Serpin domain-containing protein n=1 Tax=Amblyomma americanum TaxID=6943 RepID=A0AAQ4E1V5_AMBAM